MKKPKDKERISEKLEKAITDVVGSQAKPGNAALERFRQSFPRLDDVPRYQEMKSEILASAQATILEELMKRGKLEEATVNNLAYAFDKLNNAERLEKGLSTSNRHVTQYIKADFSVVEEDEPVIIDITPEEE